MRVAAKSRNHQLRLGVRRSFVSGALDLSRWMRFAIACGLAMGLSVSAQASAVSQGQDPKAQDPQAPAPQAPSPQVRNPRIQSPGTRIDQPLPTISGELYFDAEVQAFNGKIVRSIQIENSSKAGGSVAPVDEASSGSIVRSLETRVGQPFQQRNVSADCSNLWTERRLVVRAYAQEVDDEIVVTFKIDLEVEIYEDVEFVGLDHLSQDVINGLIGFYPGRRTTRTEAEAMRKLLLARYRRDGYAFCNIQLIDLPLLADPAAGLDGEATAGVGVANNVDVRARKILRVLIEEGPSVSVRNIDFIGNRSFPSHPILGLFGTDSYLVRDARIESDPAGALFGGGAFSREVLEEDLDRLRLFYRSRGFLEATVDLADVSFTTDRKHVDLSIIVVEGPRYRIRSVKVQHVTPEGAELTSEALYPASEVEEVLTVLPGEFYDNDRLRRDQEAIEEFYGRRGHPSVNFPGMRNARREACQVWDPVEYYADGPEVDVVFRVSEGSP